MSFVEYNQGLDVLTRPSIQEWPREHLNEQEAAEYQSYVEEMARAADGSFFLNHDESHAEIVLEQLFKSADNEVKILTGRLRDQVYGCDRVRAAAIDFVSRNQNAVIQILSEQSIEGSRLLESIRPLMRPANLSVSLIDPDIENSVHFVVADARHFRYEENIARPEAIVAFGLEDFGQGLSSLFDRLVDASVI